MIKGPRIVSLLLLFILLSSSFAIANLTVGAAGQGHDYSDKVPAGLQEWAKAQPKQYAPDGTEMPFDATPYFLAQGSTGSRETGSRTLNACGNGYDQQGGGTHEYLLVATGDQSYPNASQRAKIISEFDNQIWPTDTNVFGGASITKIDICAYYMDGAGGLGGYFSGGDNIYVDTADISGWGFQIIAHEFQHMIHASRDWSEDLWLNEGCADLAILVNYGGNASGLLSHISSFEQYPDNDLTQFDNQGYDYGSAFTYMAYVWEHFGGNATINSLVGNTQHSISSVTGTLSAKGYAETGIDAFYRWTVANIVDDTSFDGKKWGYDAIDIHVSSTARSTYPDTSSGSTNDWAADYYSFTSTSNVVQDLKVTFSNSGGSYRAYLAAMGRFGTGTPNKVVQITSGSAVIEGFGPFGNYSKVYLIVAAGGAGGSYSYTAELVDKIAPVTTMVIAPAAPDGPGGWYVSKPSVSLSTDEPATILYHFDSGADQTYSASIKPPEGDHVFHFHAVDGSNNIETEHGVPIKVDSVKPTTTLTIDPTLPNGQNGWYNSVPTVTLTASEPASVYYAIDGGTYLNYTAPFNPPEGTHNIKYYSTDMHGNKGSTKSYDLKVDSLVPETKAEVFPNAPDGKNGWYTSIPSIRLTTDQGAKSFYWWDGGVEVEYSGDLIAIDGTHTLYYYSRDDAGNKEELKTVELKVDTSIPESGYSIDPVNPDGNKDWYVSTPTVTLEVTRDFSASIFYKFDSMEYTVYEEAIKVPDGDHTLTWYAMDPAGNSEGEHTQEIMVDTSIPVTTLTVTPDQQPTTWYTKVPDIKFNVSEQGATILYHWDYEPVVTLAGTLVIPEGRHVLYYHAVDEAGNTEAEKNREIRLDTQPPVAIITGPIAPEEGSASTYDARTSSDSNGLAGYYFDFGDGQNSGWITASSTSHTFKSAGKYTVSLKVKDKAGLESQPQSMIVSVKKKPVGGGFFGGGGGDDGDTGTQPFYKRTYTIAGVAMPFLLILLILILILIIIIATAVAVARRRRRIAREKALRDAEPIDRVTVREEDDRDWRPRKDGERSYIDEPSMKATEPYEFGYPSYVAMDDQVEAVQMSEPLDKGRLEGPASAPAPTVSKPAAPPAPKVIPGPPKAAPVQATAVKPAQPKAAPPAPAAPKPAAPAPKTQAKKADDVDVDSEISDLLSRLGP